MPLKLLYSSSSHLAMLLYNVVIIAIHAGPDGNGVRGIGSVGPDSEGKPAMEDNTTVSSCPL